MQQIRKTKKSNFLIASVLFVLMDAILKKTQVVPQNQEIDTL